MPASLPGATLAQNQANPSQGGSVIFDLLSGPKNSPFDAKVSPPGGGARVNDPNNCSTGALSTGIGMSCRGAIISQVPGYTNPQSISKAGFTDDYVPGVTKPDGNASADSTLMYIGGGKNTLTIVGGDVARAASNPVPYVAGFGIGNAGGGGSRDAGAGPAFTGFASKMVTAAGAVAIGAAVEAGFLNRTPRALVANESVFGSSNAASAAPA